MLRYKGCKFMRSENASPLFTFIPIRKRVLNYARFSRTHSSHKIDRNAIIIIMACSNSETLSKSVSPLGIWYNSLDKGSNCHKTSLSTQGDTEEKRGNTPTRVGFESTTPHYVP